MKYVIIGAVAGGASTAARLRRLDENAEIIIFEKGEYISYANCGLPYYIGDVIKSREKLFVQTATAFHTRFNIDVRTKCEVIAIYPDKKCISYINHESQIIQEETYDKLVLAPGAEPIRPPLPGITLPGIFTLRTINDTDLIKAFASKNLPGKAVIVGGGFIGLEMAENLKHLGMEVTIVELGQQILAPVDYPVAAIAQQYLKDRGINLELKQAVVGFEKTNDGLCIKLNSGKQLYASMVILSIGVKPDTKLAVGAGLKIGDANGIWVNEYLQTSEPDIYAVGDAIEYPNPITGKPMTTFLAGPANKQGRICANNLVLGNNHFYKGAINTAIIKLFDMTFATTGLAGKTLEAAKLPYTISTTTSGSHAGYYPGAHNLTIQIAFSPLNGKLYGAQIAGFDGVDKRIDIIASLIQNEGTIEDLAELEHAYAPPYSSAKDPLNMAGFVADNLVNKRLNVIYWNQMDQVTSDDLLIDVRNPDEYANETIPNAINIPIDELRGRLGELPKNKDIYIFCQIGLRGYLAQRILLQSGFTRVHNLSGGFGLYKICIAEQMALLLN